MLGYLIQKNIVHFRLDKNIKHYYKHFHGLGL